MSQQSAFIEAIVLWLFYEMYIYTLFNKAFWKRGNYKDLGIFQR